MAGATLNALVDAILPPRCASCRSVTASVSGFCVDCWGKLDFLIGPACARCDVPFEMPQGEGALCGNCLTELPPYSRVHAALAYGDVSRTIAIRLKYGRRLGFAKLMARLIHGTLMRNRKDDEAPPLIVPVPLHRWRIWSRGFNQSAEIGRELSRLTGWPLAVDIVQRHRSTPPLRGLGRKARARTVSGAFNLPKAARERVAGRAILLVDDVFTTGATVSACARLLVRAGAADVQIATFARVVERPDSPTFDSADVDTG